MLTGATMSARLAVEECFKWAHQRKVRIFQLEGTVVLR